MRMSLYRAMFAFFAIVLAFGGSALAQSGEKMDEKAMMEAFVKAATPGEQHKLLAATAGTWTVETKAWMVPGQPAEVSTGTAEIKVLMDGRYIAEHVTSEFAGMPFSGLGLTGYDNIKKRYVSTWIDNFGTGIVMMEGDYDPATKTYTYEGTFADPMTGAQKTMRSVAHFVDANKHVAEMYDKLPDGKWLKTMELTYTRK